MKFAATLHTESEVLIRVSHLGTVCDSPIEEAHMTQGECVYGLMASICNTTDPFELGDGDYTTIRYVAAPINFSGSFYLFLMVVFACKTVTTKRIPVRTRCPLSAP